MRQGKPTLSLQLTLLWRFLVVKKERNTNKSNIIGKEEIQPFLLTNDTTEYIGTQSVYQRATRNYKLF